MTYEEIFNRLIDETLDPDDFTHAAHVGAAFEALRRETFADALATFSTGIRSLAVRAGAEGLFSATITFAYFSAIAERMRESDYADAAVFIEGNPDLLNGSFLKTRFSRDRLSSPLSKEIPLLPDLI